MSVVPELAVVIACTRPARVTECLAGLAAEPGSDRIEVFVVGELPELGQRWPFPVGWIRIEERHANVRRNEGIRRSTAPRIAVLDDDAVPVGGWLAAAMELEPEALTIKTGPERPYRREAKAQLVHAVSTDPSGEVSSGHHNSEPMELPWYRVPFSNFVTTRAVFDRVGLPAVDVPWDVDDFEFCLRARSTVRFEADPQLQVRHDRYPASYRQYLRQVGEKRLRTGEKVVTHPAIYLRIPSVAAGAVASCTVLPTLVLIPPLGALGAICWLGLLGSRVPAAAAAVGWRRAPQYVGLLAATQAITAAAVSAGMARAAWTRLRPGVPLRRGSRRR